MTKTAECRLGKHLFLLVKLDQEIVVLSSPSQRGFPLLSLSLTRSCPLLDILSPHGPSSGVEP